MSADLFAEFGAGSTPGVPASTRGQPESSQPTSTSLFDDFGDFEQAGGSSYGHSSIGASFPESKSPSQTQDGSKGGVEAQDEDLWRQDDFGDNVLFDATTEEGPEDDDWGEFESADSAFREKKSSSPSASRPTRAAQKITGQSTTIPRNPIAAFSPPRPVDLLSNQEHELVSKQQIDAAAKPSTDRKPLNDPLHHRKQASKNHSISTLPDLDDEWGDFTEAAPDEPSSNLESELRQMSINVNESKAISPPKDDSARVRSGSSPDNRKSQSTPTESSPPGNIQVRPVNIPPPFVILQLFTPILEQYHIRASNTKLQGKPKDLSDSLDSNLVSDLVCTLRAAARVMSGRTLRWKRDTALSQSTKIGPARSGKSGGMKLSSINKSESIKEEKEAMDVLDAWRSRAGLFNSIILAAGRPIPLISGNLQARPATADEGALKAPHACALCGLKRDEKIPKIDEKVEDSFGEWWIDYWGHTDCKNFWDKNSHSLYQR